MAAIQVLSQETIDKIAAGEVIERPASVIKELVENAIDAGASAVTVEIRDGGTSFIRVTDNGCGISREEIALAFLRHSTSKITSANDLSNIGTLGFRGEALSSISAVSQVELLTKTRNSFAGIRYCIEGGIEKSLEEVGTPDGTTFLVRNLFYNTPARKKFLKTNTTEGNYIQDLMERLALSHPEISFKLIHNNQIRLHTSGNNNLQDVIYQIYGRDVAANLIPIRFETEEVSLTGFIGKPVIVRGNRQYENYFVNGRYVKSNIVCKAIEQGYKNYMMQHKYPFTVLHVTFFKEELDVNVHPTKMELRFSDGEKVYRLFYHVISEALQQRELIPDVQMSKPRAEAMAGRKGVGGKVDRKRQSRPPESFEKKRMEREQLEQGVEEQAQKNLEQGAKKQAQKNLEQGVKEQAEKSLEQAKKTPLMPSRESVKADNLLDNLHTVASRIKHQEREDRKLFNQPPKEAVADQVREKPPYEEKPKQMDLFEGQMIERRIQEEVQIIGQVFDTYWILQFEDKVYMVDQHAAHEKVLYERTMARLKEKEYTSQLLSPPMVLTLSGKESQLLEDYREEFERLGFSFEAFGGKEYAITAVPDNLFNLKVKELFLEMLDDLSEELGHTKPDMMLDKIASMSCKAAIKGNQHISQREAQELLRELMSLDNPYNCPHGRPVLISMSKYEIEKKFKRII